MTFETFFKKFNLFADTPDAVAVMQKLVLQLAVQGKLVEQDPSEGDASALLEAIAEERSKSGRGKTTEDTESVELPDAERWHEVPSSWRWVRLGTVGNIVGGGTPRSDNPTYFADEGVPWLTPADLNGFKEKRIFRGRRCITKDGLENSSAQLLPEGSVLFSSRAPIGYVVIAGTELATNQGFKSCVPFIRDTNEFLYYFLLSAGARIDQEASGTTFREVSGKIVSQIPVPLPSLAEQKRIVAKVDKLMALCDRLEAQQQEREARHVALARASLARFADAPIPANLDFLFHKSYSIPSADLRKSILTLAVEGKLIPRDPKDEPAEELLRRIEVSRETLVRHGTIKRAAVTPNPADDEVEGSVPTGWLWTRLGTAFDVRDGTHDTPKYTDAGYPLITSKNISSGVLSFDTAKLISEEDHRQISERSQVNRGDILFAMIGSIGNPVIVDTDREFSIKNVALFKYFSTFDAEPRFLLHYLTLASEEMRAKAAGGVQSFVSLGYLRNYPFPLPPLAEQRRIVAKVDQLMVIVDQLELYLTASHATGEKLMEALVAELTTQD